MGPIKEIMAETQFQEELSTSSQAKLVVVDFTASWCGPCQTIAPFYEQLSRKYPNAVFLKVDVDKCQETAVNQRVSVMPTFHFYRNKVKVDSIQGADPQKLEEKILKYYDEGTGENEVGVAGHKNEEEKNKREATCVGSDTLKESTSSKNVQVKGLKVTSASKLNSAVPTKANFSTDYAKDEKRLVSSERSIQCLTNNNIPAETVGVMVESVAPEVFDNKVSGVMPGVAKKNISAPPSYTALKDYSKSISKQNVQTPRESGQTGPGEVPKVVTSGLEKSKDNSEDPNIKNSSSMPGKQSKMGSSPQPQSTPVPKNSKVADGGRKSKSPSGNPAGST